MIKHATASRARVSIPCDLADEVKAVVGARGVSAYVAQSVRHQLAMDGLGRIVEDFEANHPSLTEAEIAAASRRLFGDDAAHVAA